mmetsp:Transcript_24210/g.52992  ORF Transcript_24210/g.52992 Transcript_24210/m.52992 type:complete len:405 (-) Transcript_24210:541-1755(-)
MWCDLVWCDDAKHARGFVSFRFASLVPAIAIAIAISDATTPVRPVSVLVSLRLTISPLPITNQQTNTKYHGDLIGFQNLYILDGSTDTRCISFLRYARDVLGANVIYSTANMNELDRVITRIATNIAGSSDFLLKVDTDEYLFAGDPTTATNQAQTIGAALSNYLSGFATDQNHPLRKLQQEPNTVLTVKYVLESVPSKEICANNHHATPGVFPLEFRVLPELSSYKRVFDAAVPGVTDPQELIGLGGHVESEKYRRLQTEFGMAHYHLRCIETEVENNKKAVLSHGFIDPQMTDTEARIGLQELLGIPPDHRMCTEPHLYAPHDNFTAGYIAEHHLYQYNSMPSFHKAAFLAKYWTCPEVVTDLYYAASGRAGRAKRFARVSEALERSMERFGANESNAVPPP